MKFFQEIIDWIKEAKPDKETLSKRKLGFSKKWKQKKAPTDIDIYLHAKKEDLKVIRPYLQTKPVRTGSGVAIIAAMTPPFSCPHGSCIYCPGGLGSPFGNMPKSYTGKEPSTMRAIRNEYDPYRIIFNRLEHYIALGQNPDKVDQIIMGGTFASFPHQKEFIYYSFKAYNDFSRLFYPGGKFDMDKFKDFFELPGKVDDPERAVKIKEKVLKLKGAGVKSLEKEQEMNETAAIRNIGITIETRPDRADVNLLELGVTRVELGIQTVYEDILKKINRGYSVEDAKKSISDLRDLGFKLNFHMMPGLPTRSGKRISKQKDIESLKKIFTDADYRPDMLKIYPCMVMEGTELEKEKEFKPLSTKEAAEIIAEAKKFVPEYCRIMRVQRDIPTYATKSGVDKTNLRQYVAKLAAKRKIKCRCIRCREIGKNAIRSEPEIIVREYNASNGKEFFISMEADDKLLGFVRLRFPPRSLYSAITLKSALIRELHVYGMAVAIGKIEKEKTQHKGVGRELMAKAEETARKHGKDKMVVVSGVGAREYYRKIGYSREGPYMVKRV